MSLKQKLLLQKAAGLISADEVAALIGISVVTVINRADSQIPAQRFGTVWRFQRCLILEMMSDRLPPLSHKTRLVRVERVRIGVENLLLESEGDWEDVIEPAAVLEVRRDVLNVGSSEEPEVIYGMTTGWFSFPHITHPDRSGYFNFRCTGLSGRCRPTNYGGPRRMSPPKTSSEWTFIGAIKGLDLEGYFGSEPAPTDAAEMAAGPKVKRPNNGLSRRDFTLH